jgi:hypothetical protein
MPTAGVCPASINLPSFSADTTYGVVSAFAHHTNLPIDALLLSSFVELGPSMSQEKLAPLVYYIAVDHASKAIVL